MKIRLEIGEIVLHGFNVTNAAGLDRVIEAELTRMLSRSGGMRGRSTAMKNIELKTIEGGDHHHRHSSRTTQDDRSMQLLGTSIAKSIYGNLERRAKQR